MVIGTPSLVTISEQNIQIKFQKRAHDPYLIGAGFGQTGTAIFWLGGKKLKLVSG